MSKIPKISGNQMIMYLQKKGFVVTRRKGSHLTLRKENVFTTVPAGNDILSIGTQHGILTDVGIIREEFISDYETTESAKVIF